MCPAGHAAGSGRRGGDLEHRGAGGDRRVREDGPCRRGHRAVNRVTLGLLLVVLTGLVVAEAQAPGKWVKLAAFPEPAEELYGAAAAGKVYVFGGLAPGWQPRGLVFEYDPAIDKW